QVLDARVDRLGAAARDLLTIAAVIGQDAPLALWQAVAGAPEDDLLAVVERAAAARLLDPTADGLRFAHALVREALYERVLPPRRRRLHRQVAEALLTTPAPDPDAVAYHFQQAGDPQAVAWLIAAGERAQMAYAWLTAADRYEAALALDTGVLAPRERAVALLTLAQLRRYSDPQRGSISAAEAVCLAEDAGDALLATAARFDQAHLRCLTDDLAQGLPQLEAAFASLASVPLAVRAQLPAPRIQGIRPDEDYHRGALVNWLNHAGRYAEALAAGAPIAARAAGTTARGLAGLAQTYAALGQPDEARRAITDARAAFAAAGQYQETGQMWLGEFQWIVWPYQTDQRVAYQHLLVAARQAFARAAETMGTRRPWEGTMLLDILWLEGHWEDARAQACAEPETFRAQRLLALLSRAQGDPAPAWQYVRDEPYASAIPGGARFQRVTDRQRLAAALALDAGDLPTARAWLETYDRWLAWSGAVLGRAEGCLGWAAYYRAVGDLGRARHHADQALAHASAPRQPLALLAAHRLLGELVTAAGQQTEAATHLAAALALADACAAPYEWALCLLAQAELQAASGDRQQALAAIAEARTLLEPLQARLALARADALTARLAFLKPSAPVRPANLTPREMEVLRLLAAGRSNREMAAALSLSARTVERHITNLYRKLDVRGRAQATAFALHHHLT
ncbi:MAG TPA: LuxR C-terminal-related transcriptional regulator, partial [Nitrolancea sp.]|nr:LuxR C-terminal-related transcriptional regulator [Nitrolancea sp.]